MGPPRGGNGSYSHCSARRARGGRGSGLRRAPREASYRRAAGRRTRCGAAPGRQPRHPITSSLSPVRPRHLRPRAREPRARLGPGALGAAAPRPPHRPPPPPPRPRSPAALWASPTRSPSRCDPSDPLSGSTGNRLSLLHPVLGSYCCPASPHTTTPGPRAPRGRQDSWSAPISGAPPPRPPILWGRPGSPHAVFCAAPQPETSPNSRGETGSQPK